MSEMRVKGDKKGDIRVLLFFRFRRRVFILSVRRLFRRRLRRFILLNGSFSEIFNTGKVLTFSVLSNKISQNALKR